jgi:hypothetical protein
VTFSGQDNTGYLFGSGFQNRTKISETVPNPDKFIGEPPQWAAQPPHAVAK